VGQSLALSQPQEPLARHALPDVSPRHEAHMALRPHAEGLVPGTHIVPSQQPPLHACVDEHAVVHAPVVVSHASPVGHSTAEVQLLNTSPLPASATWESVAAPESAWWPASAPGFGASFVTSDAPASKGAAPQSPTHSTRFTLSRPMMSAQEAITATGARSAGASRLRDTGPGIES
jgi:hypothetical protein